MSELQGRLNWLRQSPLWRPEVTFPLGGAAGMVVLADISTVGVRTALTGGATLLDSLVICPGLHRQSLATQLNQAEYPAVAALTTGYVFRVENPATVFFLQRISKTGALTNLTVSRCLGDSQLGARLFSRLWASHNTTSISTLAYLSIPSLTIMVFCVFIALGDGTALIVLGLLVLVRLCNSIVIARRSAASWHGQSEPGIKGDLLVLLSQDRWVRIRGVVDDLKATTSGQWLREPTFIESSVQSASTLLTYGAAGMSMGMHEMSKVLLLVLLAVNVSLLAIANKQTVSMLMHGCMIELDEKRGVKQYSRRLQLVEEMLKEPDRNDESMRLGLARMGVTVPGGSKADETSRAVDTGAVTM
ncbi:uncharacterized protein HMPREF1541_04771 [Cyphellophora europaea CBS 101466]|uniref:Uncharacterized protein n=1 Tax=Cyphellophora europaea (strain CBS 101466) TaxID=1220924 RepID=W2RXV0_CYPE1|nr:uncharacterized protein HMPREF1541_04771 [Cyphellophora europaea CBS 101466]ETN40494.1 hypothetical protein HMPREF1541_04771 [Cyphellophora europaea CBS 101466]